MSKITNCPNCGAPLGYSSKCEYCGTIVERDTAYRPIEYVEVRPGMRKLEMKAMCMLDPGLNESVQAPMIAARLKADMVHKPAEQLAEAVKFTIRQDYSPYQDCPVVLARGELWVADCDPRY